MLYFSAKKPKGGRFRLDRAVIKSQAQAVIKRRQKPILIASLLYVFLVVLFSYLSFRLTTPGTEQLLQIRDRLTELAARGDTREISRLISSYEAGWGETLVSDLLSYLQAIVAFGFLLLCFHAVRGDEVAPGMLLDGFALWVRVLLLELLTRIIITAGFWMLIVPGVIFLYNYRMTFYLLLRRPEFGVMDCLRESRLRMRGHRMELFRLDLSFLGWGLLSCIPVLGLAAAVWALPYWTCSCVLFYESVSTAYEADPPLEENRFF